MKQLKNIIVGVAVTIGLATLLLPETSFAINVIKDGCTGGTSTVCASTGDTVGPLIHKVVNVLLFVLGAIAVIMIVVGGIMYTTSAGDAGSVKKAKDTILYAVIGLIVALLAYGIVNFVVTAFK